MTSIKDVAKKAGVSITTVSRAFNGYSDISRRTRDKIFDVATELNYVPNVAARNLSSKRKKNFAIVFSSITAESNKDNIIQSILVGASDSATVKGVELTVHLINTATQHIKPLEQFCREHNIHILIIHGLKNDDPYYTQITSVTIPVVLIDIQLVFKFDHVINVSTNNFLAMKQLADKVIASKRINYLIMSGIKNAVVNVERLGGLFSSFSAHGIDLEYSRILYGDYLEEKAQKLIYDYFSKNCHESVEVIYCLSDLMALGVLTALKRLNLEDKIIVTGFDGIPILEYVTPQISTVKQNMYEIGYESISLAQSILKNEPTEINNYVKHELLLSELL